VLVHLALVWAPISAEAATPEQVVAQVAEIAPMREIRVQKSAPLITEAEVLKVANGTPIASVQAGTNKAYGAAVIPLPIALLWAAINDETRHPGYTAVEYSELLSGSPCRDGRRVLQYLPVPIPMVSDRWWIGVLNGNSALYQQSGGSVRELYWKSSVDPTEVKTDSGKRILESAVPIASSSGAWFLVALDERSTWAEYYVRTDPGEGVPSSVASKFAAKGVRETMDAIVRFAQTGNPSCPVK
jgi:hypothetical protein